MHIKTIIHACMLISLSLAASTKAYAFEAEIALSDNPAPFMMIAARADDDPFAGTYFDDDTDEELYVSESKFADPLQGFNRPMFTFNDKLYYYILKPTAQGFAFVLPERSRICLKNCFYNLSMPIRAVNCLLQGKGPALGVELWRFIINSTAGIGGLFDPAGSIFYLPTYDQDTGLTFGVYGAGPGPYLMLPVLGASSGRDATGTIFDFALDPLTYFPVPGLRILETVVKTSLAPDEYDAIKAASLDPYVSIRDGYLQYREAAITK
jgi:phospholipid-binding lipoprotein MlaA